MSKVFSHIAVSDGFLSWEFNAPGWVLDEDDFMSTDGGSDIIDLAIGDLNVDVRIYCFGEGESVSADEDEVEALTEEFIDKECDCIQGVGFTIYMEDNDDDTDNI